MIHWAWAVIALLVGVAAGMLILAYAEVSRHADERKKWWDE